MLEKGGKVLGLDQKKIDSDKFFDGLKGYITNTEGLGAAAIIEQYHNLWRVEKAFRMSKNDLRERPIYPLHQQKDHLTFTDMFCIASCNERGGKNT